MYHTCQPPPRRLSVRRHERISANTMHTGRVAGQVCGDDAASSRSMLTAQNWKAEVLTLGSRQFIPLVAGMVSGCKKNWMRGLRGTWAYASSKQVQQNKRCAGRSRSGRFKLFWRLLSTGKNKIASLRTFLESCKAYSRPWKR